MMLSECLAPAKKLEHFYTSKFTFYINSKIPSTLKSSMIASGQTLSLSDRMWGSIITGFMNYGMHTYFPRNSEMQFKHV